MNKEQTKKLQELSSGAESSGFKNGVDQFSQSATDLTSPDTDGARNNFERLVLGKKASPTNGDMDMWGSMEPEPAKPAPPSMSSSFAWSSNNAGKPTQAGSLSQQSNLGFRSITPDQKLSTFPTLEPARQTSPVTQAFPAMQPSSSIWGSPASPQPQIGGGPSLASMSSMAPSNSMPRPMAQQAPNYSAFSIPPPPAGNMGTNNAMRSPPLNTTMRSASFQSTPPTQGNPKQGLDKYESLI